MSAEAVGPHLPEEEPTPAHDAGHDGGPEPGPDSEPQLVAADPWEEGEPPERRYPSTIGGAFYIVVLLAAATGIGLVVLDDWRLGVRVVAAALGGAAALRLVLPGRDAGMLRVRHRSIDVLILGGVAAALFYLAGSIPDQPPLP